MMHNNLVTFLLFFVFLLSACQPVSTVTPTTSPAITAAPTNTIEPEPTLDPHVTIVYNAFSGGNPHGDWEKANVDSFMELYPDIIINHRNYSIYSTPVPQTITLRMKSDPPPDVVSGPMAGLFLEYVEQGLIADITDLWDENGWYDKFPKSVIDMATVNGRQYFVPTMLQYHPIWYNTDVFAKYYVTPPQTWDELLAICDKLSSDGQTPITLSVSGWNAPTARWFTYIDLRINGYDFHTDLMQGKVSWQDERVRNVFAYWKEMFDHNCFADNVSGTNYGNAANNLADGTAAMYLLGEWLSESYPAGIPENMDHFPVPVIDPSVAPSEIAHQYGAFIHTGTQHPEEAKAFLTWLGSVEVHNSFGASLHRISTHADFDKSLFDDKYWRGVEMTVNTGKLTSLFELGTHPDVAMTGLSVFTSFIRSQNSLDSALERLEAAREEAYGPLP